MNIRLIITVFLLLFSLTSQAKTYPKFVKKRINKTIIKALKIDEYSLEDIDLSEIDLSKYFCLKDIDLKRCKYDEGVAYVGFSSVKGKQDYFEYMLVFDTDLKVKRITVLIYRSSYGSEIMSQGFLRQFYGKTNGEKMEIDIDIDSVSGATISAAAISDSVSDFSILMSELKKNNIL